MLQPATSYAYAAFQPAYADWRRQLSMRQVQALPKPVFAGHPDIGHPGKERWTKGGYGVEPWQDLMTRLGKEASGLQRLCFRMIEWYQRNRTIHDGVYRIMHQQCPYGEAGYESCSQFAKEAIARHGVVKGIWRGIERLVCCNPITYFRLKKHQSVPMANP